MHLPTVLAVLAGVVAFGTIAPFLIARRRFGSYHSAVVLAIGIALGTLTGFVLESVSMLAHGHTTLQFLNEWSHTEGRRADLASKWSWVAIAALLGMLVSFISIMLIGPWFIPRVDDSRQPTADPDLPKPD